MRPFFQFVIFILLFLWSHTALAWTGKVIGISDGDTIKVLQGTKQIKIRLHGIDTPEKKQAFGNKAKKHTAKMVAGKTVEVKKTDTDRYGRTVALVTVNGQSLNQSLVEEGYAWVYRKYCKQSYCKDWLALEEQARNQRIGMWSDPHTTAPWEWLERL